MFGNLGKIMKLASEMKTKMPELQARLGESLYTAEAGDGAVRATVNGRLAMTDLHISKELLADGQLDAEMLAAMVKTAVASAQTQATEAAAAAMKELTGGLQIPGMDALLG